ncbi:hypothetical protein RUM43_003861 [Polyplax serrata]|uniref:Ferric-chelate reductase 1 homolog n=1 Tax=Polyplax serrata TaxID=468196 RepID=A0AAN8S8E3_POLSC
MAVTSRWTLFSILVITWTCFSWVETYPSGAPVSTCGDMVPRHLDFQPQRSPPPYFLQPSTLNVKSGNKIKVMLSSQRDASFVGFMVQARALSGGGDPIGGFTNLPDITKAITCGSSPMNTATHRDRNNLKNLELEWEAPEGYEGPVTFNATFVQNGATFWVGVESEPVQVVKRSLPNDIDRFQGGISTAKTPKRLTTVPNYTLKPEYGDNRSKDPIYKGCDRTKSCFAIPAGCIETESCQVMVTTYVRGEYFEFELMAKNGTRGTPKYVAVGLSHDQKMSGDSVTECVVDGSNKVNVYMSYNIENEKNNERLNNLNDKVTLKQSKFQDGNLYCKFTREPVTRVKGKEYDLVNDMYYLLLASGTGLKDGGKRVGWHDIGYEVSDSARHLSEVGALQGSSNLLYRLHGALMVASWIGFTSAGILLARYFKTTWVGKRFCGKDQWFIWHRAFMVSTWCLTISAFVMIFVQVGGWYSETSNPHGILGCITTGLSFIQPFGAALRPSPDSPKRPLFNWLHWLVGNSAHILGIVTIFFAVKLNKAELPEWTDWVLVAYVAFHVLMHLVFSVVGCCSEDCTNKRVNDFPMKDMGSGRSPLHMMERKRDSSHAYIRKFLLAIYLTVIVILSAILIVIIVLAPIEDHWTFQEAKKILAIH